MQSLMLIKQLHAYIRVKPPIMTSDSIATNNKGIVEYTKESVRHSPSITDWGPLSVGPTGGEEGSADDGTPTQENN